MKFLVILIVLLALIVGGYFIFAKIYKTPASSSIPTQAVSCTQGAEGNAGDNYCSNTYKPSSKCLPRTENTYSDGCTK